MKKEYNVYVFKGSKDRPDFAYTFYVNVKSEAEAKNKVYALIQKKCRLFKNFVNINKEKYILISR